jgi:hypothetical protein
MNRSSYTWTIEGNQDRPTLTVKEASVVFGMENDALGPMMVNLVLSNPTERSIEILWGESSISAGEKTQKIALGLTPDEATAEPTRNAVVPAKGLYAQSLAPEDSWTIDTASGSPRRRLMPGIALRIRVIYRILPGGIPSAFTVVLTPAANR